MLFEAKVKERLRQRSGFQKFVVNRKQQSKRFARAAYMYVIHVHVLNEQASCIGVGSEYHHSKAVVAT